MTVATRDATRTGPPQPLPEFVYSTAQVRAFDHKAIGELGISGAELMNRAAAATFAALQRHFPRARYVVVYCGGGNNAGDGYGVARLAVAAGLSVTVVALTDPARLSGDAAAAYSDAVAAGVTVVGGDAAPGVADVIVDAIFGTGLTRAVEGRYAAIISAINADPAAVLSVDVPSGLDGDSGHVLGTAVVADLTVTFIGLKTGLFLGRAPEFCGRIEYASLDVPAEVFSGARPVLQRLSPEYLRTEFRPRPAMSHKGLNGNVLLVGGSPGMAGAIRLAAEAALRGGAGLVRVATHPDCIASVMAGRPELMCRGVLAPKDIDDWILAADAVVLGPGLGRDPWGDRLCDAVLKADAPLIVDADGLNRLAGVDLRRKRWLLTPHPGEAARLLGVSTADVQNDRLGVVRALAVRYGADVILKGACSLVAELHETEGIMLYVCDRGNPGMASGGMGDVLAGLAGALVAQRRGLAGVARLATLVHALAGDDAAAAGERGMLASDLIAHIRTQVNPR